VKIPFEAYGSSAAFILVRVPAAALPCPA